MLVVVVLLPIVIMVVTCLLERFEAHAVTEKPTPRVRRPLPAASPAEPAEPAEPAAPALALVPGADAGAGEDRPETVTPQAAPAPGALRRAS
ncbi:hypothetical protein PHK61_19880 [Actinomycetospora lutea]|uniref:hypothetical protein n=1 Tax=Actinomycetospora lutea TaxID=663604 RepID=UPI0023661006|nr:hypothetical protein [Actinomycetospora lutea]MDD7940689.1 hypothetical protein [Actinomycetospora lutea]